MRREERHHLKANPLAALLREVRASLAERERVIVVGLVVFVVALAAVGGYLAWQQGQAERAGEMLGQAMTVLEAPVIPPPADPEPVATVGDDTGGAADEPVTPPPTPPFEQPPGSYPTLESKLEAALPRLLEAADAYPSTGPGLTARYHAATALSILGRASEAASHYEQVMAGAPDALHGHMARLGLAEAHLVSGEYEEAIRVLEALTAATQSFVPVDAVLMRLGEAYRLSGQTDQALASYSRVVEEFPLSVYYTDAQQEVDVLLQSDGGSASGE